MIDFFTAAGHLAYEYGLQAIACILLLCAAVIAGAGVREREE